MRKFLSKSNKFLLLLFQLLALSFSTNAFAQLDKEGEHVSLINLIATPDRYDGKTVYVTGYVSIAFENMSICLSKEISSSTKDCLWLSIDSGPYDTAADMRRFHERERIFKPFHGKVASIRGVFDAKDTGHLGMWSGAIRDIVEIYGKTKLTIQK